MGDPPVEGGSGCARCGANRDPVLKRRAGLEIRGALTCCLLKSRWKSVNNKFASKLMPARSAIRSIVPYAHLLDIVGRPRCFGDFIFVPALLEFDPPGEQCEPEHLLKHHSEYRRLATQQYLDFERLEALWVRARIPGVFAFAPPGCGNDWQPSLVDVPFLAIVKHNEKLPEVIPFVCREVGVSPGSAFIEVGVGLGFHPATLDHTMRKLIANRFWALLLESPNHLSPFTDHVFRLEWDEETIESYWKVGYEGRVFFEAVVSQVWDNSCSDANLPEIDLPGFDGHLGYVTGDVRVCADCGGTGEEDLLLNMGPCQTCLGKGTVTW
jgi:hypothetical protein